MKPPPSTWVKVEPSKWAERQARAGRLRLTAKKGPSPHRKGSLHEGPTEPLYESADDREVFAEYRATLRAFGLGRR